MIYTSSFLEDLFADGIHLRPPPSCIAKEL